MWFTYSNQGQLVLESTWFSVVGDTRNLVDVCRHSGENALTTYAAINKATTIAIALNPSSGRVEIFSSAVKSVEVINLSGERVAKFDTHSNVLDLSMLNDGLYFLLIENDLGFQKKLFVKTSN